MKQSPGECRGPQPAGGAARQQWIEELIQEHRASLAENAVLRQAAHADQLELGELKTAKDSLGASLAELGKAQSQIELLNRGLNSRNAALESVNKELESFSYAVSHDLRSPLRSIHGFSEALMQSAAGKFTEEERGWLRKISDAAGRVDRLTEDLLRLSRITRSQLRREPTDLAATAREVVQELRQSDPHREVAFVIPDCLEVKADPVLRRVAITNLLENAWKYTGRCEQALISFGQEDRGGQNIFYIRDNRAGFDMAYATKLFAPFQRLHSAREFPGSGVGLACVARVYTNTADVFGRMHSPVKGRRSFVRSPVHQRRTKDPVHSQCIEAT